MNLDALTLSYLKSELHEALWGARIDKVYQVNHDSICLYAYNKGNKYYLLIDVSKPCICMLDMPPAHMDTPTAFCMLLRKHLEMSRLTDISQYKLDRILNLQFDNLGFANQIVSKKLCIELTGKNSNIILLDEERILQAIRHVSVRENSFRQIQPNQPYVLPPQRADRLDIRSIAAGELMSHIALGEPTLRLDKFLGQLIEGVGQVIIQELLYRAGLNALSNLQAVSESEWQKLESCILLLQQELNNPKAFYLYTKHGRFVALAATKLQSMAANNDCQQQVFATVNQAVQYLLALVPEQTPEKIVLSKTLGNEIGKQERKLLALQEDLSRAEDAQDYKILADNLMAYLYTIKPQSTELSCTDIYDGAELVIKLDAQLSPIENANRYYRQYNKAKRALSSIDEQLQATGQHIEYLQSLEFALSGSSSEAELHEIKKELQEIGLFRISKKSNKQQNKPSVPLEVKLDNATIYIGRNNQQNDYLTFKIGRPNDIWLHVQKQAGSHVIIKCSTTPDEATIKLAAELAAYFSKSRNSSSVAVDYVQRKHVWKPAGAKPGFVLYENQNTVYVTPDADKLNKIL